MKVTVTRHLGLVLDREYGEADGVVASGLKGGIVSRVLDRDNVVVLLDLD